MADKPIERKARYIRPRCTVSESENGELQVRVEMPGVRKEDLEIRVENNGLQIVGRRESPRGHAYILRERPQGDFLQTFTLDDTVDQSKVDAKLEKGVLNIKLELKEQVKPKTVRIRSE
jgi:HSP20 family protein